jgi:hypothetical protein
MTCFLPSTASASNSPILVFPFFQRSQGGMSCGLVVSWRGKEQKSHTQFESKREFTTTNLFITKMTRHIYIALTKPHIIQAVQACFIAVCGLYYVQGEKVVLQVG